MAVPSIRTCAPCANPPAPFDPAAWLQAFKNVGGHQAEQRNSDATDEFSEALDDLMAIPAPDGPAVIHKIELAREFDLDLDPVLADLQRLFQEA
jgi:hypothetical protein